MDMGTMRTAAKMPGWRMLLVLIAAAAAGLSAAVDRDAPTQELRTMHKEFVLAFAHSDGFGPARITPMMRVMQGFRTQGEPPLWVEQIQLIGIARHDPPRVFDGGFMGFRHNEEAMPAPRPDEGRAMTAEERRALRDLEAGRTLVVEMRGERTWVVGPINAAGECLGCHKNKRAGDLLGAFVYTLGPLPVER